MTPPRDKPNQWGYQTGRGMDFSDVLAALAAVQENLDPDDEEDTPEDESDEDRVTPD